ncbi:MAG: Hint domain-containing protein [Pseudomonadota bacterium]
MPYTDILSRVSEAIETGAQPQPEPRRHTRPQTRPLSPGAPAAAAPAQWTLPGFGPMTRISTSFGEVHAQALRMRDLVRTQNGNLKPIQHLDRVMLDQDFTAQVADATAIVIRAGALGAGLPKQDVVVSPRQEVGIGHHGAGIKWQPAAQLLGRPGVLRRPEEILTYTMFHCGEPVVVKMEGLWARVIP